MRGPKGRTKCNTCISYTSEEFGINGTGSFWWWKRYLIRLLQITDYVIIAIAESTIPVCLSVCRCYICIFNIYFSIGCLCFEWWYGLKCNIVNDVIILAELNLSFISFFKFWVWFPLMARCTPYNFIFLSFSVTCGFLWVFQFPPPLKLTTTI